MWCKSLEVLNPYEALKEATMPDLKPCSICMDGAPYRFCCKRECGEHEFCRGCTWNRRAGEEEA